MTGNHKPRKHILKSFDVLQMVRLLNEGKILSDLNLGFLRTGHFALKKHTCENDGVIPSSLPLYI